jgi:glutathione S-transferase
MLELYHSINSVCAQKVRIALAEKGLTAKDHLMTLRGDQFDPAYLKLNPSGVVPTFIHDGQPVIESAVILSCRQYLLQCGRRRDSLRPSARTAAA